MLLPGVVSSIADHGLIINIGFAQRKGFLANDKHSNIGKWIRCMANDWGLGIWRAIESGFSRVISSQRIEYIELSDYSFETHQWPKRTAGKSNPRGVRNERRSVDVKALSPAKLPFHMLLPGLKCKVTILKVSQEKSSFPREFYQWFRLVSMVSKSPSVKQKDLSISRISTA